MRESLLGALAVAVALFSGWCVVGSGGGPGPRLISVQGTDGGRDGLGSRVILSLGRVMGKRRKASEDPALQLQHAALLVAQLSALLRAGRTPEQMWRQASETHTETLSIGSRRRTDQAAVSDTLADEGRRFPGPSARRAPVEPAEAVALRALTAAAHAAGLGRPVAAAIREACLRPSRAVGGSGRTRIEVGVWMSVATCIETAEASGSPLVGVLDRLANELESDADAAAARAVALAGPKATAKVLSVLPVAGLGLGMLMGADPLSTLLATPLGSVCLGLGCALTAAGRWWSARLVRSASEAR